jgi:hypothetical protein
MEKDKVPQDNTPVLDGKLRVLKYAVDKDGSYTQVPSVGWEPESIVLTQAWEEINEKAEAIKKRVIAGELSPIAYYMEKKMFTEKMLAEHMGCWQFTIRKHLNPKHFRKLSQQQLEKYSNVFQISTEQLVKLD